MSSLDRRFILAASTVALALVVALSCTTSSNTPPDIVGPGGGGTNGTGPPSLLSVVPQETCANAGNLLTLVGRDLVGGSFLSEVTLNGVRADVIDRVDATIDELTIRTRLQTGTIPSSGLLVDVRVTNANGADTLVGGLRILPSCTAGPIVVSVSPVTGSRLGQDSITISGDNLACVTSVQFVGTRGAGSLPAEILSVISDQTIIVASPTTNNPSNEPYEIVVTSACGTNTAPRPTFTYTGSGVPGADIIPDATAIFDTSTGLAQGPAIGGNRVKITGRDLDLVTEIRIGGVTLDRDVDFVVDAFGAILISTMPPSPAGTGATVAFNVVVSDGANDDLTPVVYTYLGAGAPTCTTITPNSGSIDGGDQVEIRGTGLGDITQVLFGGIPAETLLHPDGLGTRLIVTSPPYPFAIDVDVQLQIGTDPDFTTIASCLPARFTYIDTSVQQFSVTDMTPHEGPQTGGTAITIVGTGLSAVNSVRICNVPATIVQALDEQITATTNAFGGVTPTTCDVVVSTSTGLQATLPAPGDTNSAGEGEGFIYRPVVPDAQSFDASSTTTAPACGGTTFRLNGVNFIGGQRVRFGGSQGQTEPLACDVQFQSNSQVSGTVPRYITPSGPFPANVNVVVESAAGGDNTPLTFRYYGNPDGFSARAAGGGTAVSAGDVVIVTGTNFRPENDVFVGFVGLCAGTTLCATPTSVQFTVVDNNTLQFVFPDLGTAVGPYSIVLRPVGVGRTCTGTAAECGDFMVSAISYGQNPNASRVTPSFGPYTGGTTVTITGDFSLRPTAVQFCGVNQILQTTTFPATSLTVLTVGTPEASAGTACDVDIVTALGTDTVPQAFTFIADPDVLSAEVSTLNCGVVSTTVSRPIPVRAGQTLTLRGSDLIGVTKVSIGTAIASINEATRTDTSLDVSVPTLAGTGVLDVITEVTFTSPAGTFIDTLAGAVQAQGLPAITSITPPSVSAGSNVTIAGTVLSNVNGTPTIVFFDDPLLNNRATILTNSDTSIFATVPPGTPGATVLVTVRTCQGDAVTTFTYPCNAPSITTIAPSTGSGGTSVTITGSNLLGFGGAVPSVTFGTQAALPDPAFFGLQTNTAVHFLAPTGSLGQLVNVTLNNCGGTATSPIQFQYLCVTPTINSVSPSFGVAGTSVTITGINLDNPSGGSVTVRFGGAVAGISASSGTSITALAPAGAGTVDVSVQTCGGTATQVGAFTYCPAPTVSLLSPGSGPADQLVTITGTNLQAPDGTPAVVTFTTSLGSAVGTVVSSSPTSIGVQAPAGLSGVATVSVRTCGGAAVNAGQFQFCTAPSIASITPAFGAPGSLVTITGTALLGADGLPSVVRFGTTAVTTFTSTSATRFVVVVPAGVTGQVAVDLTTCGGTAVAPQLFASCALPVISGLVPTNGPVGTEVTISGTDLIGADGATSTVLFGTTTATIISAIPTEIVAVAPAGFTSGQVVSVRVRTCGGTSAPQNFTYQATTTCVAPTVTSISPLAGPAGSQLTITGTNLIGNDGVNGTVTVGSVNAPVVAATPTTLVVTVPAGATSPGAVRVTTCGGFATASQTFTSCPAPTITSIAPPTGNVGQNVLITGTNFLSADGSATTVTFGNTPATVLNINGAGTQITVSAPAGFIGGTSVNVRVTTCGGTVTSGTQFTYTSVCTAPAITSIAPTSGVGGTSVVITGTNLLGADGNPSTVNFSGTPAIITQATSTQFTVTVPAGAAANLTVNLVTCGGTATATQLYSRCAVPTVTSLTPNNGPAGTEVQINGTNLQGQNGAPPVVTFATTNATIVTTSPLVVVAPAGFATGQQVQVRVQTCGGTTATGAGSLFTYQSTTTCVAPTITNVSPTAGPVGSQVTLTGTNMIGNDGVNGVVTIGGVVAPIVAASPTTFVVTLPAGAASPGAVRITTCGATLSATAAQTFVTCAAPTITGIAPNSGPTGTTVIVTGTNFIGADGNTATVAFGTTAATVVNATPTQLTVLAPAGIATGTVVNVRVTTCGGTTATLPSNQYTYTSICTAPSITSIAPTSGLGGTSVVITGTNLLGADGNPSTVNFSGAAAAITQATSTQFTVTVPAGAAANLTVNLVTCGGTATATQLYSRCAVPTVTSLTPNNGPAGTEVTINGTNLQGQNGAPPVVTFATTTATIVTTNPLVVVAPAGFTTGQQVQVRVQTCGGTSATGAGSLYTYQSTTTCVAPTITNVSPTAGPVGSQVTLTGTNLIGNDGLNGVVTIGGVVAPIVAASPTTFVVTVPAGAASPGAVRITTCGATLSATAAQTFITCVAPTITGIAPSSGPAGTTVIVTGTNYIGADGNTATVTFGTAAATVVNATPTQLTVLAPAGIATGTVVNVRVTTCGGTTATAPANEFTYSAACAAPAITSIAPTSGLAGSSLTITGTNLLGADGNPSVVRVGGVVATQTQATSTQFIVTVPAGGGGQFNVTLQTCGGTATATQLFSRCVLPDVTSLNPTNGPTGTEVDINGTDLVGANGAAPIVTFGTTQATIVSSSPTVVTVIAPGGFATGQVVNVRVQTCGGTSIVSGAAEQFTYQSTTTCVPPTVAGISPISGPSGIQVTISGTNLIGNDGNNGTVLFGVNPATVIAGTPTSLVVTVPAGAGIVAVRVTTCGGAATSPQTFRYCVQPAITSLTPNSGPAGSTVLVNGTNLVGADGAATSVTFGNTAATVLDQSPTQLTVTAPAGFGAGTAVNVRATTCGGTSPIGGGSVFTYVATTTFDVTSITPTSGPRSGGQLISIGGTGLTGVTSIVICGVPATGLTGVSDTQVTATTGAFNGTVPSTCDVVVTKGAQNDTLPAGYTYLAALPDGTIFDNSGAFTAPAAGGLFFRINGSNLLGVDTINFGGRVGVPEACAVQAPTDTYTTGIAPAYITPSVPPSGIRVDVFPESAAGVDPTAVVAPAPYFQFTYYPNPTIASASPSIVLGGELVTLTGASLMDPGDRDTYVGELRIRNAGFSAPDSYGEGTYDVTVGFTVINDTTMQFRMPTPPQGDTYYLTIKVPNESLSCVNDYEYSLFALFVDRESNCSDAIDNELGGTGDGLIDCADGDCAGIAPCP